MNRRDDASWRDDAACRDYPSAWWFVEEGKRGDDRKYLDARPICRRCNVQAECLAYALEQDIRHGMWGGLSVRQRAELRRQGRRGVA